MQKGKADFEDVGIMAGFKDMMNAPDDEEAPDERDSYEEDNRDEMVAERRPDSPEIMMNHLRGDMRSLDARREELADMVGYKAAKETPDSVLAMLQPLLAKQQGLGTLPMAQGPQAPMPPAMPPGMGIPPMGPQGGPPPGPPPGGLPPPPVPPGPGSQPPMPMNMAHGGYVQHFELGSGSAGVTPADGSADDNEDDESGSGGGGLGFMGDVSAMGSFAPTDVASARTNFFNALNSRPIKVPTLAKSMAERESLYKTLLGQDKGASEAQLLFSLGQRALQFAGNVDDQGRPLRGSFVSRLAGATRTLPNEISARVAELDKLDRNIQLAALQAAEKDVEKGTDYNTKLFQSQLSGWREILRGAGATERANIAANASLSRADKAAAARIRAEEIKAAAKKAEHPFGVGNAELNHFVSISPKILDKTATPEEQRIFASAVVNYTQEKQEGYDDPSTGKRIVRTFKPKLPGYVERAIVNSPEIQKEIGNQIRATAVAGGGNKPGSPGTAQGPRASSGAVPPLLRPEGREVAPGVTEYREPVINEGLPQAPEETGALPPLYDLAPLVTGPISSAANIGAKIPGIGGKISPERQQARTYFNSTIQSLIPMLTSNPRFPVAEQEAIKEMLDIQPGVFDSGEALQNRIKGVDQFLAAKVKKEETIANDPNSTKEMKRDALSVVADIQSFRKKFVPRKMYLTHSAVPVYSAADVDRLPDGTWFLWNGNENDLRRKNMPSNAGAR